MSIYTDTLFDLVKTTSNLVLHDYRSGVATGGSTSTVVDSSRAEQDDYFNSFSDAEVYIYETTDGLAPQGETKKITDFANSTGTFTIAGSFTVAVGAGDKYEVHMQWTRQEVIDAINMAINMVAKEAMFWAIDETVTLVADTYEYEIPTNFMFIHNVTISDADSSFQDIDELRFEDWSIVHGTKQMLRFRNDVTITADRIVRIEGLSSPDILSTDADVCPVAPSFITFQAGALLNSSRIKRQDVEPDAFSVQANVWQAMADRERAKVIQTQIPFNSRRVRE